MEDTLKFQDIIKKSVIKLMPQTVDTSTLVLTLGVALLLGICIFLVYRHFFMGVVYDHSYSVSLVIMTILVAIIIITISSNITLSLGMVGALSIVRYRTAVKNPMDLVFMFWSITTGIAVGAGYYYIAAISFVFVTIALLLLSRFKSNLKTYVLIIHYDNGLDIEEQVRKTLGQYRNKLRSKIVSNDSVEMTVEMNLKIENVNITNKLSQIPGVTNVTLVQYRSSYEL